MNNSLLARCSGRGQGDGSLAVKKYTANLMYALLAGFLAVRNEQGLLEKVRGKLKELPPEELQIVGDQIMMATEPIFWELTDPMINFDYVDDEQKEALATIFDELTAQKPIVVRD